MIRCSQRLVGVAESAVLSMLAGTLLVETLPVGGAAMLAVFLVLAVVPVAVIFGLVHLMARAVFPSVPVAVTITAAVGVAAIAPVVYFLAGDTGQRLARALGSQASHREGVVLVLAVLAVAVAVTCVVVLPRQWRRDAAAWWHIDKWRTRATERVDMQVGWVQRRHSLTDNPAWVDVTIDGATCQVWLTGRCAAGEAVLLHCDPQVPAARVTERLSVSDTARAARHARRRRLTYA